MEKVAPTGRGEGYEHGEGRLPAFLPGTTNPGHAIASLAGFATGSPHRISDHTGDGVRCL